MKKYLLIRPSEDGEPCHFLDGEELARLLKNPWEEWGIRSFLTEIPDKTPMYWEETEGLLLKIEILKPKSVTTAFALDD